VATAVWIKQVGGDYWRLDVKDDFEKQRLPIRFRLLLLPLWNFFNGGSNLFRFLAKN
jgi:hypothetical protein